MFWKKDKTSVIDQHKFCVYHSKLPNDFFYDIVYWVYYLCSYMIYIIFHIGLYVLRIFARTACASYKTNILCWINISYICKIVHLATNQTICSE